MSNTDTVQFSIRRLSSFEQLFTRLARKAVKLGLAKPSFKVTGERTELADVFELSEGEKKKVGTETVIVHDIEITGLSPVRLSGWDFIALVETLDTGDNLIYARPDMEGKVPARFSTSGCTCEHCNVNRRRLKTYIVQHGATNEFKQVGSTCLADFVGGNSAESVAALFAFYGEIVHDLDALRMSESEGWEGGNAAHDLRTVIARSLEVQAVHGWMSGSKAYAEHRLSTADRLRGAKPGEYRPTEDSLAKADTAIAYFASIPASEATDGLTMNARVLANAGYCSDKSFGLACALWTCYNVAITRKEREARKEAQRANSKHIFKVGERVKNIEATILSVFTYDTDFGPQTKTILEDREGNVLVAKDLGTDKPGNVRFTATVKEHSAWDGVKQTKLLRAAKIVFLGDDWKTVQE